MLMVPAFRRIDVTTAYEWLEHRFHWSLRLAASALYMLFQVARVAVVTLLPALALAAVTGLDVTTCILVMGVICILYTVLGGIEAVIWSDVIQAIVLFGGGFWALGIMISGSEGGLAGMVTDASAAGKLRLADLSVDLTGPSLLVIVLGGIFSNIIPYASDQSVVQRYLAVKDVREAKRAVWAAPYWRFRHHSSSSRSAPASGATTGPTRVHWSRRRSSTRSFPSSSSRCFPPAWPGSSWPASSPPR